MSIRRYNDFISARRESGRTLKQARSDYRTLKAEGLSNLGRWHASRIDFLKSRSYINERNRAGGVTKAQAYKEARQLISEGRKPGKRAAQQRNKAEQRIIADDFNRKRIIQTLDEYYELMDSELIDVDSDEWASSIEYSRG